MTTTVNQRLEEFLFEKKLKQEDLRKKLYINNRQQISNWITNKEQIPAKHILNTIEAYPELNADWLLNGRGQMLKGYNDYDLKEAIANETEEKYFFDRKTGKEVVCKKCIEKDGMVKILKQQLREKEHLIGELQQTIGSLKNQ